MRFRTIVFDLDGTLIDSAPDLAEALNRVLADNGLAATEPAAVRHMVGEGAAKMIERGFAAAGRAFDGPPPESLRLAFLAHYEDCLVERTRPFPGVADTLASLAARQCRLAICSNKPEAMSRTVLKELGLAHFFPVVLGGDSLEVRKPDPVHLTTTITRAGGAADSAVMVGDSITDVAAARAAGVPVIVVNWGYTRIAPADLGADAVISHFPDLLPTLEHIARARQAG